MFTVNPRIKRRFWSLLFGFSLILFPLLSHALQVQDVPNTRQQSGGGVTDMANILSEDTEAQLNQMISELEATTGAEVAVVTVGTTAPSTTPKDFTTELFNEWGIGKAGVDNGVLFLTSVGDRRVEIETGYGIEGLLPDAQVGQIINTEITPKLRRGDWDGGILAGTEALVTVLSGNPWESGTGLSESSIPTIPFAITAVITLAFSGFSYTRVKSIAREPMTLKPTGRSLVIGQFSDTLEQRFYRWIYIAVFSLSLTFIFLILIADPSGMLWRIFAFLSLGVSSLGLSINLCRTLYNQVQTEIMGSPQGDPSKRTPIFMLFGLLSIAAIVFFLLGGALIWGIIYIISQPLPNFRENGGLLILIFLVISGLITAVISPVLIAAFRAQVPVKCQKCQTPLIKLNPNILCDRFTPPQQVAKRLGSTRFEGWHCSQCYPDDSSSFHLRRYLLNPDCFRECPHCQEFTIIVIEHQTLKKATYERGGILQIVYECQSCHHREDTQKKIPRLTHERSNSYGVGYGSDYGGGGGFSGGGGGGGFGGGSSGGGGAGGDF